MALFGTDGIRDLAGQGALCPERVANLGRALAGVLVPEGARRNGSGQAAVGRDPRPSGEEIARALADGLAAEGVEVRDLGIVPTPVVAWWVVREGLDLGIAVSASHNPPEWNGLKPFVRGGRKLETEEEARVEAALDALPPGPPAPRPAPPPAPAAGEYVRATVRDLAAGGRLDGLRLVVDLAAGATSPVALPVLEGLGAEVSALHACGSRPINDRCGTEHPGAWREAVRRAGAWGLAFDGDGDRVLLADEEGEVLDGHDSLAILARDAKERGRLPGDLVVSTVMANLGFEERLLALGIRLLRVPVGDRHVAAGMRATRAAMGGEPSGHVVLERDGALVGDGLLAGIRVLQAARRRGATLADLRRETPRYPQVLKGVRVAVRRPVEDWPALARAVKDAERLLAGRGRVLVRWSGTEPLLRIMAEGHDAAEVERVVAGIEAVARG